VPVVFFIAVEVVLWHVRRGRGEGAQGTSPAASPGTVPSSAFNAAKARMLEADRHGFRYSNNEAAADFGLKRAEVTEARRQVAAESPAVDPPFGTAGASGRDAMMGHPPAPSVPAALNGRGAARG